MKFKLLWELVIPGVFWFFLSCFLAYALLEKEPALDSNSVIWGILIGILAGGLLCIPYWLYDLYKFVRRARRLRKETGREIRD
jgi:hypothetical protein